MSESKIFETEMDLTALFASMPASALPPPRRVILLPDQPSEPPSKSLRKSAPGGRRAGGDSFAASLVSQNKVA